MEDQVVNYIQTFFTEHVFETKISINKKKENHHWKESWLNKMSYPNSPNHRTNHTIIHIQDEICSRFEGKVLKEVPLQDSEGNTISGHKFDLLIPSTYAAIEICLGNIKNEFEKDVFKGMLDSRVTRLYIFTREYITGKDELLFGYRWFDNPANKSIISLAKDYNLEVIPMTLVI
jgi:hypothetical protein